MKPKHYPIIVILCALWLLGCYLKSTSAPTKINGATDIYDHTITGTQINTNSDLVIQSVAASGTVKAPTFESATGAFSFSPSAGYWLGTNGIGTTGTGYPNSYLVSEILDGDPGAGLFLRNASGTKVLAALFSREGIATKLSSAYLGVDTTTGNPVTGFTSSIVMADSGYKTTIIPNSGASANVQITLPAASGTLALTSGIIMPTLDQVTTAGAITSNAIQTGAITSTGNITATSGFFFEGNGSHLTGISSIPKLNTSQVMYMDDATNTISIGATNSLGFGVDVFTANSTAYSFQNGPTSGKLMYVPKGGLLPTANMLTLLPSDFAGGNPITGYMLDESRRNATSILGGAVTPLAGYDGDLQIKRASDTLFIRANANTGVVDFVSATPTTTMFSVDVTTGHVGVAGKTEYYGDGSNLTGLPAPATPNLSQVLTSGNTAPQTMTLSSGGLTVGTNDSVAKTDSQFYGDATDTMIRWDASKKAFQGGAKTGAYWDDGFTGAYSFNFGYQTRAEGDYSTGIGYQARANPKYSIAMGYQATTFSGSGAEHMVAIGNSTTANGEASLALGNYTTASGDYSIAIGRFSESSGTASYLLGANITCTGTNAVCLGSNVTAGTPTFRITGGTSGLPNGHVGIGLGNTDATAIVQVKGVSAGDSSNLLQFDTATSTARLVVDRKGALSVTESGYNTASNTVSITTDNSNANANGLGITNTGAGFGAYITNSAASTGQGFRVDMNNTSGSAIGMTVLQKGSAESIWSYHTGAAGQAGLFQVMNTDNANQGLQGYTKGYGNAIVGHILTEYSDTYCNASNTCNAGWFWNSGLNGTTANGSAIFAEISNPSHQGVTNPDPVVRIEHHGAGDLIYASIGATTQTKRFQVENDGDTYIGGHVSSGMAVQSDYQVAIAASSTVAGLLINQNTADGSSGATGLELNITKANNANEALYISHNGTGNLILASGPSKSLTVTNAAVVQAEGYEVGSVFNVANTGTIHSHGGLSLHTFATNTSYLATVNDYTLLMTAGSSGDKTVTLPACSASINGMILNVKKVDAGSSNIIIDGNASETIDGATTVTISSQYTNVTIQCDGSGAWWVL